MKLRVGTRGSDLALVQTKGLFLLEKFGVSCEIKIIKTTGDLNRKDSIEKLGGKEIFTREIEKELLSGEIDFAVHSLKDLPSILPKGLKLSYSPRRESAFDAFVSNDSRTIAELANEKVRIGTGSKRRAFEVLKILPHAEIVPIRGNVETRIRKMKEENLTGLILAEAGLNRLGLSNHYEVLGKSFTPHPCQGILGLEIREERKDLDDLFFKLSDEKTRIQKFVERSFLKELNGSCKDPMGAFLDIEGEDFVLYASLAKNKAYVKGVYRSKNFTELAKMASEDLKERLKELGEIYE